MALQKNTISLNFANGLDTKNDPWQIEPGKFLSLNNTVFTTGVGLNKRNGFKQLAALPDSTSDFCTTFNGNLMAIGTDLKAYLSGSNTWVTSGSIIPCEIDVQSVVRENTNISQSDSVTSANGFTCIAYSDDSGPTYKYSVVDSSTGQSILVPADIPVGIATITGAPRVFLLGNYFIIVVSTNQGGTDRLQYVAIKTNNPTAPSPAVTISAQYDPNARVAFDGFVATNLYLAWNGSDLGGAIRAAYIDPNLNQSSTVISAGNSGTIFSVTADITQSTPVVYVTYYNSGSQNGYTWILSNSLVQISAPTLVISTIDVQSITSVAKSNLCTILYETINAYSYDSGINTDFVSETTITVGAVVSSPVEIIRSVGLASKAFLLNGSIYFLSIYDSLYQPTYFLMNESGQVILKLAYSNAGESVPVTLFNVSIQNSLIYMNYLIKDLIQGLNKSQDAASSLGVYSQAGVNLVQIDLTSTGISTAEIGENLHLSGGFLWAYDGIIPVEHGFHLWPDYVEVTTSGSGGSITAQEYFYVAVYEWNDNQGNIFRSAPSVPVSITTTGTTSTNTVHVPTLRLTYKINSPVKITIYRWSTAQQVYYQVTSVTAPILNDISIDSISFSDTQADSAIVGNNILYTTGGVIENIEPPAVSSLALFKSRLLAISAEDPNTIWYSKQVIEGVPAEFSDLFTIYIAPTIGAQGSTGPNRCLAALDDKIIIFKDNAINYIVGNGPDNAGFNNDFSDPVLITSTVGCANQNSIVFTPLGLLFQSSKGIWLLGRDLSTNYIGAPVERYNQYTVLSAQNIPGTNQVRFSLSNGLLLMYDYYYAQWGTFTNVPAISSTIYQNLHTYINDRGEVFQENPGSYLDGSNPVLVSFTTGWFSLAGLQGFERVYFLNLLAHYYSPHKLNIKIAYDFNPSFLQNTVITPNNYNPPYGSDPLYGDGSPYGGPSFVEKWRVFLSKQKCESFQITLEEGFDASYGVQAGAGLSLSAIALTYGVKKGYRTQSASTSVG